MPYPEPKAFTRLPQVLLLSLLLITPAAHAAEETQQSRDIAALRQQLQDLQVRVQKLEREVEQGVPVNIARKVQPAPGGWRKAANWKRLDSGMTRYQVVEFLGEPDSRKTVKKFEFWYYGDGKVSLYLRRLKNWETPSGLDPQ